MNIFCLIEIVKNYPNLKSQTLAGSTTTIAPDKATECPNAGANSDASTTDGSDDDLSAVPAHHVPQRPDSFLASRQAKLPRESTTELVADRNGGKDTGSDTTGTLHSESPSMEPKVVSSSPARPKARLGKIGGKKSAAEVGREDIASSAQTRAVDSTHPESGKSESHAASQLTNLASRGRVEASNERKPASPRETSKERADRNRENLKRELGRSQAGGKKKRKF